MYEIKGKLSVDIWIIPLFHSNNAMRDFAYEHGLWTVGVAALKYKLLAKELDINRQL
jgi:hypothetical protein